LTIKRYGGRRSQYKFWCEKSWGILGILKFSNWHLSLEQLVTSCHTACVVSVAHWHNANKARMTIRWSSVQVPAIDWVNWFMII